MSDFPAGNRGLQRILKGLKRPFLSVGKQIVHRTLLRFPGGDAHDPIACTYCPEMCRFSCPTAVVSGNDAVTPCNKMGLLHREERWPGQAANGAQLWPLYDCTGCGRCSEFCVYGMPVAETLFEARKEFAWEPALAAARALTDEVDPVGDLADELGDGVNSIRRREAFVAKHAGLLLAEEPRSLEFLLSRGHEAGLAWEAAFNESSLRTWRERLSGRSWLVHESSWLSRRLGSHELVAQWMEHARASGISLVLPFHHGKDCIDCGGEGAYSRLFEEQSKTMAREIWARDKHRAQGILCFSQRCASHLRAALGGEVPIVSLSEIPRRMG